MKKIVVVTFCLFLSACDEGPQPSRIEASVGTDAGRFSVTQVAKFDDSDAYWGNRKIFLIRDKQTSREFVGVSGVGISEVGTHSQSNGKQVISVTDER
ncbi:hypothetical protein NLN92_00710 [Citrobacter portucalensis]|uniref:hypothetical protein n=1 Tax=Citrobacter portucalensis TaxID=1639133 RepID=UPI00226B02E7|nr:hypothetical protein [Citrobacter portucalensis]MCX8976534.1 hypothetical protein [Citrobacter portucalensis]